MRCNLFKPINAGDTRMGTFLMFSQYTEDLTKEHVGKGTYRVIPSKFVALDLNIDNAFNNLPNKRRFEPNGITKSGNIYGICEQSPIDVNVILPQILQSYYENSVAFLHNQENFEWDVEGRSYASELLWRTLENWGFVTKQTFTDERGSFNYYDEVKYVGDINIHSNHRVGGYSYDEIFCHIPAKDDEYYYPLNAIEMSPVLIGNHDDNRKLEDWTDATYPVDPNDNHNYLINRALSWLDNGRDYYHLGGLVQRLDFEDPTQEQPIPRHADDAVNVEFNFNAVIVFYDILYSEPGDEPQYLHRFRPMGIYLSGPIAWDDQHMKVNELQNRFTKYISNNDAYGQGASFGLRIMTRYTPTPNMSTYTMEVETGGNDYETITQAMGTIADAITNISETYRDQREMFQAFKDHLAQFRNNRTNVPYIREVNGEPYWFVNGRNTGQPVGAPGPQGVQGYPGIQGVQGAQGVQGVQGYSGSGPIQQEVTVGEHTVNGTIQVMQDVEFNNIYH